MGVPIQWLRLRLRKVVVERCAAMTLKWFASLLSSWCQIVSKKWRLLRLARDENPFLYNTLGGFT